MTAHNTTRRALLRAACALTAAPLVPVHAQTTEDYRALVCIFLAGGCDGHNVLVPQGTAAYAAYRSARAAWPCPISRPVCCPSPRPTACRTR